MTINALTQWSLVGIAVVLAVGYAARVLLPSGLRRALARMLRARGAEGMAKSLEAASGCGACAVRRPGQ